jgi:hypothetical protein
MMQGGDMKTITALATLAAVALLAACTAAGPAPAPTIPVLYTPSVGYAPPSPMPGTISSIPDGVFRTRVLQADLVAKAGDPSNAGTWTVTLTHGAYTLACEWVDQDNRDCGNDGSPGEQVVETGPVRGDSAIVYFAPDLAAVSKINGCSSACGSPDPYRLAWKVVGGSLVFTDFTGYGGQRSMTPVNNWTIQPWTKIG